MESGPIFGTIFLFICIGDSHINVWLGIVQSLAVDVILRTPFKHRFIGGRFRGKKGVVLWYLGPVLVLTKHFENGE